MRFPAKIGLSAPSRATACVPADPLGPKRWALAFLPVALPNVARLNQRPESTPRLSRPSNYSLAPPPQMYRRLQEDVVLHYPTDPFEIYEVERVTEFILDTIISARLTTGLGRTIVKGFDAAAKFAE